MGSVIVVERLWSIADGTIDRECNRISVLLTEALLSLRGNRQFWNHELVMEAFNAKRSQRVRQKLAEELEGVI